MRHLLTAVPALLLLVSGCSLLRAGSYTVQPVRIELTDQALATTVQVRNMADRTATIQAHVVRWTAEGVKEILTENDELLLNPPMFSLEPNEVQFMRVGLRKPPSETGESTYRLILEELPPPEGTNLDGIETLLRISVPIFINMQSSQPELTWGIQHDGKDGLVLWAENHGHGHIKVNSVELRSKVEGAAVSRVLNAYLLSEGRKEWPIANPEFLNSHRLELKADTDRGPLEIVVDANAP